MIQVVVLWVLYTIILVLHEIENNLKYYILEAKYVYTIVQQDTYKKDVHTCTRI